MRDQVKLLMKMK